MQTEYNIMESSYNGYEIKCDWGTDRGGNIVYVPTSPGNPMPTPRPGDKGIEKIVTIPTPPKRTVEK